MEIDTPLCIYRNLERNFGLEDGRIRKKSKHEKCSSRRSLQHRLKKHVNWTPERIVMTELRFRSIIDFQECIHDGIECLITFEFLSYLKQCLGIFCKLVCCKLLCDD